MNKEAVNGARSLYYGLLSKMLVFTEDERRFDGLVEALDVMIANPMDANSAEALKEIRAYLEEGHVSMIIEMRSSMTRRVLSYVRLPRIMMKV